MRLRAPLLALMLLVACGNSEPAARPDATPTTSVSAALDATPSEDLDRKVIDEVVLQIGGFALETYPDRFVFGPEIIITRDGGFLVHLRTADGIAGWRTERGDLDLDELNRLMTAAHALPDEPVVGFASADAIPEIIRTSTRSWTIWDATIQPYQRFLADVRTVVEHADRQSYLPSRWIETRPGEAGTCRVVNRPTTTPKYAVPVPVHLTDRVSPGPVECAEAQAALDATTTPSEQPPAECPPGEIVEVAHGLSFRLPDGAIVEGTMQTDDPGPVHAEAGVHFDYGSASITVWRSTITPNGASAVGRTWRTDGDVALVVDGGTAHLRDCILTTMTYDLNRDRLDP